MMRGGPVPYLLALLGVVLVSAATVLWLPTLGQTSAALLYLLPVLLVSARGGIGPALFAALTGALAYNFFLLPPRFTLRIHSLENLVSMIVLVAVAMVTSRLATALRTREEEAQAWADASGEATIFAGLLGRGTPADGIVAALDWLRLRYGTLQLIECDALPEGDAGFSTLDLSAAAWAMHNGDRTGHGTPTMPAADWSFIPLAPRGQNGDLLAIARPADGATRDQADLDQLLMLAQLLGQARDHLALEDERHVRERLEDRDALRRTMLASLAHDFRTPLTVVTGELERLAKQDAGGASALAEARRLHRMMEDLLGAARIESGALSPRQEAVDLVDVVTDGCAALATTLAPLGVRRDVPGDLPLVEADPILLRHILINLLDNAARHAASSVSIAARTAGDRVELIVRDDGPGIPPGERKRILARFNRFEGSDRRGGSGLGLAIVKGFADAMGMTIGLLDDGAPGSAFWLLMPVRKAAEA